MKYVVSIPPVGTPITYDQVSAHARLPDTSDQAYVLMTISDVVDFVQSEIAGALFPQTLTATYYELERRKRLPLPGGPVQSIVSVTDANNTVLSPLSYLLECDGNTDYIHLVTANPQPPFSIVYVAGYPVVNGVCLIPNDLRRAMLTQFSQFYEYREAQAPRQLYQVANGCQRIYDKYRRSLHVQ